jgi:hypothetical protein
MLTSTTLYVGFNNLHVGFNNPITTSNLETQRKTKKQSKPQLVEDDHICEGSTATTKTKHEIQLSAK